MINIYNEIFKEYQQFMFNNSNYIDDIKRIVKVYTNTSSKFPIISCQLSNFIDTDYCTVDKVEKYEEMYLTIDIYTQNKTVDNEIIASQEINDELTELTIKFFENKGMKKTLCRPTPNADKDITRRTIQYQGLASPYRKNIIRR